MIIVDTALAKRAAAGKPIRVGMVGAGFMAKGVALQIKHHTPGMELVAIANRTPDNARQVYTEAGIQDAVEAKSLTELEENIRQGKYSITNDAMLLCHAEGIDAILEVTGAVELGTHVAMEAIRHGKHIIMMNAEVDGTIGPILKVYADKAGVVFTNVDGDQPGVIMNLYRYVKSIGMKPVLCGNIKGLHDPYRNPTTQEGFAKRWGQNPAMVTSFADGTKISFEQAIVANGTGMRVAKRGMLGPYAPQGANIRESVNLFPLEELTNGPGIVDYVVGIAEPAGGVFVLATQDNPAQQHYLNYYKMGEGPLYCFYTPYHLCHLEVPLTIARAVLFQDAALAPLDKPYVEVVAAAKTDLKAGQTIDGIGHYMTYGLCENADVTAKERLLPMGLAEGCVLKRDIPKDQVLTYDDVVLPQGRLVDALREEQNLYFAATEDESRHNILRHGHKAEASV
ncbi:NAD(P)H-dependent oxidoreductase [Pontibacter chinhatensis]|uniref:Predicted homoserine dehydrogenase, contains C-terminal SAF domain n=1 Tax=Pontibacter chinhatensis TaxID=1436961 RepID=A0A1I2WSG1_9BACT|nr:Gfo/Idh/MocA family oxidoreductase [Pontibacter chinhatensis]SFH04274.1 Predicted homoserine dehydrogenase, contains C-terminal SAF domain [Pontibacter chinhatensis]